MSCPLLDDKGRLYKWLFQLVRMTRSRRKRRWRGRKCREKKGEDESKDIEDVAKNIENEDM